MMDQQTIERCEQIIGHKFSNPAVLKLALTHSSIAPTRADSNERMEFLGDAVLGLVVVDELYRRYADLTEGQMTTIKSAVVSRQVCAEIASQTAIATLLKLSRSVSDPAGQIPMSVSAAVFEAIIGAIYLDAGMEPSREFILKHVMPYIEETLANSHQYNYKSLLQQYAQKTWGKSPEYHILDEKGPDHSKCFEVGVAIAGQHLPSAWGKTKKQAEQEAARKSLIQLGLLEEGAQAIEPPHQDNPADADY